MSGRQTKCRIRKPYLPLGTRLPYHSGEQSQKGVLFGAPIPPPMKQEREARNLLVTGGFYNVLDRALYSRNPSVDRLFRPAQLTLRYVRLAS